MGLCLLPLSMVGSWKPTVLANTFTGGERVDKKGDSLGLDLRVQAVSSSAQRPLERVRRTQKPVLKDPSKDLISTSHEALPYPSAESKLFLGSMSCFTVVSTEVIDFPGMALAVWLEDVNGPSWATSSTAVRVYTVG